MSAFESRLSERAAIFHLQIPTLQRARLAVYADLLDRWNTRINLTALPLAGWPDPTIDRLFLEPLAAAPYVSGLSGRWVDLGSGGGSPAFPLAVATEGLQLTLTESRGRKAAFLREVARSLELRDIQVLGRFEELMNWPFGTVNLISCRAVKPDHTAELVSHLLSTRGRMLYFGSDQLDTVGALRLVDSEALPGSDAVLTVLQRTDTSV